MLATVAILCIFLPLASCGGGGYSAPPPPPPAPPSTPQGNYTVNFIVSGNGVTVTTPLTLNVQ
ncbi:MAG: hypothetical protein WA853_02635 [Candidatus Acidiferrum sp.]